MKFKLLLAILAALACLFVLVMQVLTKLNKSNVRTVRAKRYRVRFRQLNLFELVIRPFVLAMQHIFRPRSCLGDSRLVACNIAEGMHDGGRITKLAGAAIASRYLLVKKGADTAHVVVCSAITDRPMGTCDDEAAAAEDPVNVNLLGGADRTLLMVASGAIASGTRLATTATGKVQAAVATQYPIGIAMTDSAADGDLIEVDPINPAAVI